MVEEWEGPVARALVARAWALLLLDPDRQEQEVE